jgi:universal stress protein E
MSGFRSILVGLDLSHYSNPAAALRDPVAVCTVQNALWVARASGAPLTYISAFPSAERRSQPACQALNDLVVAARTEGIETHAAPVVGETRSEIVRQVVESNHDLLVIGTHDPHGLRRLLLGSTARRLLRACPCPVLVSKPGGPPPPHNILVASDLSPLSDVAVRVGVGLGQLAHAHTHLLDVVEYPLDRLWAPYPGDPAGRQYHRRIRDQADAALHAQLDRSGGVGSVPGVPGDPAITIHVADGDGIPDHAIVRFIEEHRIDLLVLGTAARRGLAALVQGNVAERLLPTVPCSILVVKRTEFHAAVPAPGS